MECWVKIPEQGRSASALAVTFQSLASQLSTLPRGTQYGQIKLDKDKRSIRVTIPDLEPEQKGLGV